MAIIQARMGSTRLPGKVLSDIAGKPMIEHVYRRVRAARWVDEVVVATSTQQEDDMIATLCADRDWPCVRGSEEDVLDRYYQAATKHGADAIVRITADCPLIEPELIDEAIARFLGQRVDYVWNMFPPRVLPTGLDVEVVAFSALERVWREACDPYSREHVTAYISAHPDRFTSAGAPEHGEHGARRWTVDTQEDLEHVRFIYEHFGPEPYWKEILELPEGSYLELAPDGYLKVMPRPSEVELAEFYEDRYQPPTRSHDAYGRVELVLQRHPLPGRVLDIGCGRGELLAVFRDRGWDILGVEPGRIDAEECRSQGIPVVSEMPADGLFDAILLVHVLEHLRDPEQMLERVRSLLAPGGLFLCEVPNDFNALQLAAQRTLKLRRWWISVPDHLNYFSHTSLVWLLRNAGFEIVYRTTDFPMELFLLLGEQYVDDPVRGRAVHFKRCEFEKTMRRQGEEQLLSDLYEDLAKRGLGRQVIVVAKCAASS